MTPTFLTTARAKLRYLIGLDLVNDIDAGFKALAEDIDTKIASYSQGATGSKPAAGQRNRFWRDTTTGVFYHDNGTSWTKMLTPTNAVTATTAVGPYTAMAAITSLVEQEPSATRPTLVCLTLKPTTANVYSDGTKIASFEDMAGNRAHALTFILPAGKKWKWESVGGSGACKASYLVL